MKSSSRIFILVLCLFAFLIGLGAFGVRQIADILHEFDHVAQVDLGLMESVTTLNDLQLKKEIILAKLASSAEELAFGQVNPARSQYLMDYVNGLGEEFDHLIQSNDAQMQDIDKLIGLPKDLKISFIQMRDQINDYDTTVDAIFKAVERGGFQLSLDDLEHTDSRQRLLAQHVQWIVKQVWSMVHQSMKRSQRWHRQANLIFWFSLLLTLTLGLLLFAFKENTDEISRQKKDLEKLNQELDHFVHTVSHDIAGPLTTIVGYAAFLEAQYAPKLDDRGRDCIKGIRRGASRLNLMVKDMLELTKMSRVKNPYTRFPLQEAVDVAMANADFLIRQSSAKIKTEGKLPEITADRIKITAVFFNLISNAIKFAKPDTIPEIKISWDESPKEYMFYVQDNGIGILAQHHQEIFDIFKQLAPSETNGGSGVGLAIVKAAVEDHGGMVLVESVPGQGSKFIFIIPKLI